METFSITLNQIALQEYESFMDHPFWKEVLSFHENDGPSVPQQVRRLSPDMQAKVLSLIAQAFYPISFCSACSFLRFAELTEHASAREVAHFIGEVELGKHPLIPGGGNQNVRHCDQLKDMIASLIDGLKISLPLAEEFHLVQEIGFPDLPLIDALAICEVIETTAPAVIHNYADFVAQWQTAFRRPTRSINRAYLDEHNLTEGDAHEAQHICQMATMAAPYATECASPHYALVQAQFHARCIKHIDAIYKEIQTLLK